MKTERQQRQPYQDEITRREALRAKGECSAEYVREAKLALGAFARRFYTKDMNPRQFLGQVLTD